MKLKLSAFLFLIFAMFITTFVHAGEESLPDRIEIEEEDFMPEGIEYDAEGERFLLGSLAEGTVFAIADDGSITPFIEDENLSASVGLEIDRSTNRLLVVNADSATFSDPEHSGAAGLGIYDLETGEKFHFVNLGNLAPDYRHFANDVAVDEAGNAYITDSLAPVIYQVTPYGVASILLEDDRLLIDGFGGNGIVYHPDGYLIVGISGVELYKVPLNTPDEFTIIDTSEVIGADGMLLNADGDLIVASNGSILVLTSEDDWASATVTDRSRNHPASTIAFRGEEVYAIYPQTYEIVRVRF